MLCKFIHTNDPPGVFYTILQAEDQNVTFTWCNESSETSGQQTLGIPFDVSTIEKKIEEIADETGETAEDVIDDLKKAGEKLKSGAKKIADDLGVESEDLKKGFNETAEKVKKEAKEILEGLDKDLINQEQQVVSVEGVNGAFVKVGSLEEVDTSGNWPKIYDAEQTKQ